MTTIDFTPLYRSTVGFDGLADLFDFATRSNKTQVTHHTTLNHMVMRITLSL